MSGSWIEDAPLSAGRLLGLPDPLVFPPALLDLFASDTELLALEPVTLPTAKYASPTPDFGVLSARPSRAHPERESGCKVTLK